MKRCGGRGSNPRKPELQDLESRPFGHLGTPAPKQYQHPQQLKRFPTGSIQKPTQPITSRMKVSISLGGSLLTGKRTHKEDTTLNPDNYRKYAETLIDLHKQGHQLMVVCGGGKPARYFIDLAKELDATRDIQDNLGVKATHVNALLLMAALGDQADTNRIYQRGSDVKLRVPGKIWVGGGYKPKSSHDYRAVIMAHKMEADIIIKATDVDGVYEKNPKMQKDAVKLDQLSYDKLVKIIKENTRQSPGEYGLFDLKAVRLAKRAGIPIVFIDGTDPEEIRRAVEGTYSGSIVK